MKATKCPSAELNYTNFAIVCPQDFDDDISYVRVNTGVGSFVFSIKRSEEVTTGLIGFNLLQRLWAVLSIGQDIVVRPFVVNPAEYILISVALEVDFLLNRTLSRCSRFSNDVPYHRENMADAFLEQFRNRTLSIGEQLFFSFQGTIMLVIVKDLKVLDVNCMRAGGKDIIACKSPIVVNYCWCSSPSIPVITFCKAKGSLLNLVD